MRPFFTVWIGQAISLLGTQLVQFSIIWWLTQSTGSATVLAYASLVGFLPTVILGPLAGTLVDRWPRRRVLLAADAGIAAATILLALLFYFDVVQIWHIYSLLFVRALGGAFHWPAMQASTTLMVPEERLTQVGGLNQILNGAANIVMPPMGALVVALLPMPAILAIDAATALPAIGALLLIPIPDPKRQATAVASSVLSEMREGLALVLGWRGLLLFSAIGTVSSMLGAAAGAMSPLMVVDHFQGGALELGWLQSATGAGAILGGLLLGIWGGFRKRTVTSMLALALNGIALMAFGLAPPQAFLLAVLAMGAVGFLETVLMGVNGAIFQTSVPPEMQGRVFALLISVGRIATPLSLAVAGPVADRMGVAFWFVIAGLAMAVMGIVAFWVPQIMNLEEMGKNHGSGLKSDATGQG